MRPTIFLRLRLAVELLLLFAPVVIAVAGFAYVVTTFSQSTEIFRRFIEVTNSFLDFALLTLSVAMLSFQLFALCKQRANARVTDTMFKIRGNPFQATLVRPDMFPLLTSAFVGVLACAPIICLLIPFAIAGNFVRPAAHLDILEPGTIGILGAVFATIALLLFYGAVTYRSLVLTRTEQDRIFRTADAIDARQLTADEKLAWEKQSKNLEKLVALTARESAFGHAQMMVIMALFYCGMTFMFCYSALQGDEFSPLTVLGWIIGILVGAFAYLDLIPISQRSAIFASALVVAVLCHLFVGGMRSEPRRLPESIVVQQPGHDKQAAIKYRFHSWLASRPDLVRYRSQGKKYPVLLVSAQGGGAAAAYHSALSLAFLQDQCPRLASHIFAMSSVSGGSLGTASFSAAADLLDKSIGSRSVPCWPKGNLEMPHVRLVEDFFARDLFSSVLLTGLLIDAPLSLFGINFVPFDRAVALELTIENVWAQIERNHRNASLDNYFERPLKAPATQSTIDILPIYNATLANTGEPLLLSPLDWEYVSKSGDHAHSVQRISPTLNISTSTAVVLSARFPYVAPSGFIRPEHASLDTGVKIVDGGYADNTGVVTAAELVRALANESEEAEFHLISFVDSTVPKTSRIQSEFLTPLQAMLNVRSRHATSTLHAYGDLPVRSWLKIALGGEEAEPPLAWTLSKQSIDRIRGQIETNLLSGDEASPLRRLSDLLND